MVAWSFQPSGALSDLGCALESPCSRPGIGSLTDLVRNYVWRAIHLPQKVVNVRGFTTVQLEKHTGETVALSWGIVDDGMLVWQSANLADIGNIIGANLVDTFVSAHAALIA